LTLPISAFITFETEEGFLRAINFSKKAELEQRKFIAEAKEVEFNQAPEPSDIIWENRQVTDS